MYILMHKRGRCRQSILIHGQQLASRRFVCVAGWLTRHVNAMGQQGAQFVCQGSRDPASCRAM